MQEVINLIVKRYSQYPDDYIVDTLDLELLLTLGPLSEEQKSFFKAYVYLKQIDESEKKELISLGLYYNQTFMNKIIRAIDAIIDVSFTHTFKVNLEENESFYVDSNFILYVAKKK